MTELRKTKSGATISGSCDSRFERVLDAFAENFDKHGEAGASVAVTHEGKKVVDLWGGEADDGRPWAEDTVTIVFSSTKGAAAITAHMLAERGLLDLDAPVTHYWPEWGAKGKDKASVAMMLDHTAGVPALKDPVKPGGCTDWNYITGRIAAEEPFFEPGTRVSYHGLTYAWTIGEVVRRAARKSLGEIFRAEIAEKFGLDFRIGIPQAESQNVSARYTKIRQARLAAGQEMTPFMKTLMSDPKSIPALFFLNTGGLDFNSPEAHSAEICSANGIANGRALALLYRPLANGEFLSAKTISRMSRTSSATHHDGTLLIGTRFGLGFMKSIDNRRARALGKDSALIGESAFGHVGAGGSIGFADPEAGLSFGYAMNQMGLGILLNERGQGLVDAAYRSIGYAGNETGAWTRK